MKDVRVIDHIPDGVVKIPPSKSVAHRAVICAALCHGKSVISNIDLSQDIEATVNCVQALGAKCKLQGDILTVTGILGTPNGKIKLDCKESGSTLRFLIPLATLFSNDLAFTGQGRLLKRPQKEYFDVLGQNGVFCEQKEEEITVTGRLQSGAFRIEGHISSQFISGLLFALPLLENDSEIILTTPLQSKGYVDLTLDVMKTFGITIENCDYRRFSIKGGQSYRPQAYTVEGDYSNAAFFLVAGALGCDVSCVGLNEHSLQGDRKILSILEECGAAIQKSNEGEIRATAKTLSPVTVDVSNIPDLVPPLAVLLCFCGGESRIVNAGRLRIKESDRLKAVSTELNRLGADIFEGDDYLVIRGVDSLKGGCADSHNDHRIAMAAAIAVIKSKKPVKLTGFGCVKKSYPGFWEDFCKKEKTYEYMG